jgi:NADH-quinone oxidoreductase subunit K
MISITHFLVLSSLLFSISLAGVVINRKNLIVLLMCVELMLLAVNTNFIVFAQYLHAEAGEIFVFFILAVAAAESAIGLAILVLFFRQRQSINVDDMSTLNG